MKFLFLYIYSFNLFFLHFLFMCVFVCIVCITLDSFAYWLDNNDERVISNHDTNKSWFFYVLYHMKIQLFKTTVDGLLQISVVWL